MDVVGDVGDAAPAVAFESPGNVAREHVTLAFVEKAGIGRDCITGSAESVATSDKIADGNPLRNVPRR